VLTHGKQKWRFLGLYVAFRLGENTRFHLEISFESATFAYHGNVMWHFTQHTIMTRKLTLLTYALTICLTSCGQTKTEIKNQEKHTKINLVDTSIISVFPFDKVQNWIFKDSKPTDLTIGDMQKIESILTKLINDYNPEKEKLFEEINKKNPENKPNKQNFIIDLKRYKRQYVAITNSKGEKEVWVNCFCGAGNTDWKKKLIIVDDGGNCYFTLKINLTRGKYYEFMVNGDA
jgi:hypothetical protein